MSGSLQRGAFGLRIFFAFVLMLWVLGVSPAIAELPNGSMPEVLAAGRQLFGALQDYRRSVQMRRQLLHKFFREDFDFTRMARTSLGAHWQAMSSAQQSEFVTLFTAYVEDEYLENIREFAYFNITITSDILDASDRAVVHACLMQAGRSPISVSFCLERTGDGWKIYDVARDGTSFVEGYRREFEHLISQEGLTEMLSDPQGKLAELSALLDGLT